MLKFFTKARTFLSVSCNQSSRGAPDGTEGRVRDIAGRARRGDEFGGSGTVPAHSFLCAAKREAGQARQEERVWAGIEHHFLSSPCSRLMHEETSS